jgi:formamidopyrimidine-DNA glycosylase
MPELSEVEFYRRRWWEAAARQTVHDAEINPRSRVFRSFAQEFGGGVEALAKFLPGAKLAESSTHGKQMWFVFRLGRKKQKILWLGIHLGMTGHLRVEPPAYRAQKHDALILRFTKHVLVFNDARQFGRVRAWRGAMKEHPPWLRDLPNEILSPKFAAEFVRGVCARHARAPLKAVLLNQKYFPGIGNWMADEILWRAALHPALPAGRAATPRIANKLHAAIRQVTRAALRVIAGQGKKLPSGLNVHIPDTWLFNHRWEKGGMCPKTKKPLQRAEIGGRTTCWSPARQKLPR